MPDLILGNRRSVPDLIDLFLRGSANVGDANSAEQFAHSRYVNGICL